MPKILPTGMCSTRLSARSENKWRQEDIATYNTEYVKKESRPDEKKRCRSPAAPENELYGPAAAASSESARSPGRGIRMQHRAYGRNIAPPAAAKPCDMDRTMCCKDDHNLLTAKEMNYEEEYRQV